jgi:hypothetical protein
MAWKKYTEDLIIGMVWGNSANKDAKKMKTLFDPVWYNFWVRPLW